MDSTDLPLLQQNPMDHPGPDDYLAPRLKSDLILLNVSRFPLSLSYSLIHEETNSLAELRRFKKLCSSCRLWILCQHRLIYFSLQILIALVYITLYTN